MNLSAMLVYCAIMAITPGPHNLMCLYLGAKGGFRKSLRFITASILSLLVKCVLCGLLNVLLAEKIPTLVPYLKWLGALYMLYLAYHMVRSGMKPDEDSAQSGEGTIRSGILLQLLNIKSWVAALSIFSVYVVPYTTGLAAILGSALLFPFLCLLCSFLWCGFGTAIQGLYRRWRLPVSIVLALLLAACALSAVL